MSDGISEYFENSSPAGNPLIIKESIGAEDLKLRRKDILDSIDMDRVAYGVQLRGKQIYMLPAEEATTLLSYSEEQVQIFDIGAKEFADKITEFLQEKVSQNSVLGLKRHKHRSAIFVEKSFADKLQGKLATYSLKDQFALVKDEVHKAIDQGCPVSIKISENGLSIDIN
ncbi:MAG: hypothetical protein AAF244_04270 [Pseudomonadota bacterium]